MKVSTRLWYGLVGTALLPAAFAQGGEGGEGGEGAKALPGDAKYSSFQGDLDKAINNIFAGEGGEGGAGLSLMWPTLTIPALSTADVQKAVTNRTLRTEAHDAWYFAADGTLEGGHMEWSATEQKFCPAQENPKDVFYRGTDGVCYTYKIHPSRGTWNVRDNQLCLDITWSTGNKKACRYVAILLEDIALFDANGKIDGKGMKLLQGKSIAL